MSPLRFALITLYGGLALFGVLLVAVFMTGSTFGQRCAVLHPKDSAAWEQCVEFFATAHSR